MSYYDEIEIEDMTFDPALQIYHYPCPCGDRFEISIGDLRDGEDVAVCPSCSLMIKVIFEEVGSDVDVRWQDKMADRSCTGQPAQGRRTRKERGYEANSGCGVNAKQQF
jgi:diphthamide biosynthesis protein 3